MHVFSLADSSLSRSPFGFAGSDKASLMNMREAEIKHGRLAMLAVVGWPLAELLDKPIAEALGMSSILTASGESPSILNGGLDKVLPSYWIAVISLAAWFELKSKRAQSNNKKDYMAGDCQFDPLNLLPANKEERLNMQLKEIKHGRVAMMAILGFVVQEAFLGIPVVQETPFFFKPLF